MSDSKITADDFLREWAKEEGFNELRTECLILIKEMRVKGDRAYRDYRSICRRKCCLDWKSKVESGKFSDADMDANRAIAEKLGRHNALCEAANMLVNMLSCHAERLKNPKQTPHSAPRINANK